MKNKRKIGLVQINSSFSGQNYLPYSVGLLQAYAPRYLKNPEDFEFLMPIYKREQNKSCLDDILKADMVFFSTYLWSLKASSELAKEIKKVKPNTLITYGGFAVPNREKIGSFLDEHPFVDLVCHGEGERVFTSVLENAEDRNWGAVPSISFRSQDGRVVSTPKGVRIQDLNEIPSPYLTGVFDPLMKANPSEGWIGLWETTRGCPFTCTYCEWGCDDRKQLLQFNLERVFEEIDWFSKNKVEFIRCCDSNFGILKRDIEIARHLAKRKREFGYPCKVSVENTKTSPERIFELHKTLAEVGLSNGVNLAVQSLNEKTLKAVKRKNIPIESFNRLQRKFTQSNIPTFSDVILGLPEETYESFVNGSINLLEQGQHNRIYFFNLLLLPNAEISNSDYQKKYGIVTKDIEQLSIHGDLNNESTEEKEKIVIGTNTMPVEDWIKARAFAWQMSFLYYDKLLKIPLTIANSTLGLDYKSIFESFEKVNEKEYPTLHSVTSFFKNKAREITLGGSEYCPSKEWLNMCWYANEFMILNLASKGKLETFYGESQKLLEATLQARGVDYDPQILRGAIALNGRLFRQPFINDSISLKLNHDIWPVYKDALMGNKTTLKKGEFIHLIDRASESWNSWEDWCRRVIWYGHKKADYLYPCEIKT